MWRYRCTRARKWMRRSLSGDRLSARQAHQLWSELDRCASCRQLYERSVALERALRSRWQTPNVPFQGEVDAFAERVAELAAPPHAEARRGLPRLAWISGAVAAAAAVLLVWVMEPEPQMGRFTARGTQSAATIRVLCHFDGENGQPMIRSYSETPTPEEVGVCPLTGTFLFAYVAERPGYLYVFEATGNDLLPRWLAPPEQPLPTAAAPATLDWALEASSGVGPVRELRFVWCDRARSQSWLLETLLGTADPTGTGCTMQSRTLRFETPEDSP